MVNEQSYDRIEKLNIMSLEKLRNPVFPLNKKEILEEKLIF